MWYKTTCAMMADGLTHSRLVLKQVDVTHLWTAVAAAIVAFSFIFKNAIATMFDSVIFLFVVHAFDVGDGILINGDLHKVGPLSVFCAWLCPPELLMVFLLHYLCVLCMCSCSNP